MDKYLRVVFTEVPAEYHGSLFTLPTKELNLKGLDPDALRKTLRELREAGEQVVYVLPVDHKGVVENAVLTEADFAMRIEHQYGVLLQPQPGEAPMLNTGTIRVNYRILKWRKITAQALGSAYIKPEPVQAKLFNDITDAEFGMSFTPTLLQHTSVKQEDLSVPDILVLARGALVSVIDAVEQAGVRFNLIVPHVQFPSLLGVIRVTLLETDYDWLEGSSVVLEVKYRLPECVNPYL